MLPRLGPADRFSVLIGIPLFLAGLIPVLGQSVVPVLGAILVMPAAVAGATLLSRRLLGLPTEQASGTVPPSG